jgi:hypothetical protein
MAMASRGERAWVTEVVASKRSRESFMLERDRDGFVSSEGERKNSMTQWRDMEFK